MRNPTLVFRLASLALLALAGCSTDDPSASKSCADGAACAEQTSVRLTLLDVRYDLSQPVYVNNRIPVRFGLTAHGADPAAPTTQNVAVSFSLVDASPADPSDPDGCSSNAFNVEVVADGQEHLYEGFIWPTTVCAELVGRTFNVQVEFDGGEAAEAGLDAPTVTFGEADQDGSLNQLCRKDEAASAGDGCVYAIALQATPTDYDGPLIDVRVAGMRPNSSVALLPRTTEQAEVLPTLVMQSILVVNGRDPYVSATAAKDVPPGLEELAPGITEELRFGADEGDLGALTRMPGAAWIDYEITPTGTDDWLPLLIGEARATQAPVDELMPGSPNIFDHELFAEGATRQALEGDWADIQDFSVRGCFEADFTQAGNQGDDDPGDCRVFEVVLVREKPSTSAAVSVEFNKELSKKVGGDRLNLEAYFGTTNRLDKSGVTSNVEGRVSVAGKLGKSFSVTVARAFGQAHLGTSSESTGYELGVEAFGQSLLSVAHEDSSIVDERKFSQAKSFKFPGIGFGFGPVKIGFDFALGGEVFLETNDSLSAIADDAGCAALLGTSEALPACGELSRQVAPGFAFTATLSGGLNLKLVKAGISAELSIVDTSFPLTGSLAFGVSDDGSVLVLGQTSWERVMTLIKGSVYIVGKVGFKKWAKTLKVHLFSFSSAKVSATLLEETMASFEVLD